jgi:hypothetical protein
MKELEMYSLPPEVIHQTWPQLEPLIKALDPHANDEITVEQTKMALIQGSCEVLAWADEDAKIHNLVIGEWKMMPQKRIFFITGWSGSNAIDDVKNSTFEEWVKSKGGTAIQCAVRDSMGRMLNQRFGYDKAYSIYEKGIKT